MFPLSETHHRSTERATPLDALHLAAILICSALSAKLIVEERFGRADISIMAMLHGVESAGNGATVTISLDESARTAVR